MYTYKSGLKGNRLKVKCDTRNNVSEKRSTPTNSRTRGSSSTTVSGTKGGERTLKETSTYCI